MTAEIILPHLAADPVLKPLTEQLPFPKHRPAENNLFVDLLRSISSQQLSTKAAATIYTRFCALFPDHRPDAGLLLDMSPDLLRAAGLSGQKAGYMHHVATFFIHQNLLHQDFQTWEDRDILQTLTQIKGVGVWTVEMLLMFSLNRPDILPVDDLGIQQGIQRLYGLNQSGKALRKEMEKIAEPWRPYRSYACYYLWNWKDQKPTP
ncbi:MAG: DNA-3-methyladenine glycosylase family protein [Haliscomenobacter sp.]